MMNLHEDKYAFQVMIQNIHERTGYRADVIEKDYYVVLILEELSEKQKAGLKAYFKGGTALYKALKNTKRFSEDIDLSVDTQECSRTQGEKRLEQATKKYHSLIRIPGAGKTNRSEVLAVYEYEPVVGFDANDALQRFGKLKIESTSFTISEPTAPLTIEPLLYEFATKEERVVLEQQYGMKPFSVETITLTRIFIDKLFAAEAYVRASENEKRAFEAAKHIYDLAVISYVPEIISFISDETQMARILALRMKEELERLDGIPGVLPNEFVFFNLMDDNTKLKKAYDTMQNQYVFLEKDRIPFDKAALIMKELKARLFQNRSWVHLHS